MVGKKNNSQILVNLPDTKAQKYATHNVETQTVTLAAAGTNASNGLPGRAYMLDTMMHQLLLICICICKPHRKTSAYVNHMGKHLHM
jgi:hypothetical protein